MRTFIKFLITFLVLTGVVAILKDTFGVQFGFENYWNHHGVFFLIFIAVFPRLTLLLSSVASGGLLWWISWFFMPRFLVATLATIAYWHSNPILVICAWLIALGGESSEKTFVLRRGRSVQRSRKKGFEEAEWVKAE